MKKSKGKHLSLPPGKVKIKINPGRAVNGIGGPGTIAIVSQTRADDLVSSGYAAYYLEVGQHEK